MACALEMYFMGSGFFGTKDKPPIRVIHAFPHGEMPDRYSKEKLEPMINASISVGKMDSKGRTKSFMETLLDNSDTGNSLKFKKFVGGNYLRIDSTGLDGGRLRGGTADVIFYDETQDITGEAIGNTVEMLKQAKYGRSPGGVQVYFGTPKKKGSNFHKIWLASSQQYYYLGCENCKDYFPLYTPESDEWEKIWIRGFIVKCTHCGCEQDKRLAAERGKWVATRDMYDPETKLVGFHINQFYMPHIKREDIDAEKPGISPTNTDKKFKNEVLGEFYHGDSSPITAEEIIEICGDREKKMRARILPGEEQMVVMGIDYGLKADVERLTDDSKKHGPGQSYTTAVILSVKGPNFFHVECALKFPKNDPSSKRSIIDTLMRQYSVNITVGDIGFSNDFSHDLHTTYGDKYIVSRAQSKLNGYAKFDKDQFPKLITFERDHYIAEMIELLKKGNIKFPLGGNFDMIDWLIQHCASMELKPSISKFGDPTIHYVKGSTPNDGFMALLNAYLGYKFFVTKGFSINNPLLQNMAITKPKKPLAVIGYMNRRV
jgi:hypothetical protein